MHDQDAAVGLPRSAESGRNNPAEETRFGSAPQNLLHLPHHPRGIFRGSSLPSDQPAQQQAAVFIGEKFLLQPPVSRNHDDEAASGGGQEYQPLSKQPL